VATAPGRWKRCGALEKVSRALEKVSRWKRCQVPFLPQVGTLAADLEDFIEVVEIDSIRVRASVLMESARRTRLAVYDAAYLELALRRRLPLATLDAKLRESARRSGLTWI